MRIIPTITFRRLLATLTLLLSIGAAALFLSGDPGLALSFTSSAHAEGFIKSLITRLRGQSLPYGIVKAKGRVEANQVDVSSKYAGQLADILVEEGTNVSLGQVVARVSSPEFEAQLRAARSDLQSAQDALAAAEADISSRKAALEFAKSDFERGQELMKPGFITKQMFEERQRNYESAEAAVRAMKSLRDQAQTSIKSAEAKVEQIDSMIHDLRLVSPRNGRVQYQLARKGETVAAGNPIVTIADLTDLRMIIFLSAADAGALALGGEARVILDAVPNYVIPAQVSFVASESQFTPKTVETKDERAKLMFRVELRIDRQLLKTYYGRVAGGLAGMGIVRTKPNAKWPAELDIKLPPAPVAPSLSTTPAPVSPAPAPTPVAPAPAPVAQPATPAPAPAPVARTPVPAPSPIAKSARPAPAPAAEERAPAPVAAARAPVKGATTPQVVQESAFEFAPQSLAELAGAWAPSETDCGKLFQRRGKALVYRQPIDKFARAAIVDRQRVRLPSATCLVESASKKEGALRLIADCKDSLTYTSKTVYIKLRSSTELFYSPTGDPVLGTTLIKCPKKISPARALE